MKKLIAVIALLVLVSVGAFALDMSIGGGLLLDYSGGNGVKVSIPGLGLGEAGIDLLSFGLYGFNITEKLFLRASALFQIRFGSKYQNDLVDYYTWYYGGLATVDTTWGMGSVIKVGIGYRL